MIGNLRLSDLAMFVIVGFFPALISFLIALLLRKLVTFSDPVIIALAITITMITLWITTVYLMNLVSIT